MVSGDFCRHDWAGSGCPECRVERNEPAPFVREERYIVVKRKNLTALQEAALRSHIARLGISSVECVVVEADWPEYEDVWDMIEKTSCSRRTR